MVEKSSKTTQKKVASKVKGATDKPPKAKSGAKAVKKKKVPKE